MTTAIDLEAEARRITRDLGGTWHGSSGSACCPAHFDRKPSLSISPGRRTVLLHCFAGCEFTDVIRAVRQRLCLPGRQLPTDVREHEFAPRDFSPLARRLWSEARDIAGTLAERYLEGRGLAPPWTDLRFHPRTPIGAGAYASFRPSLIAAIRDRTGLIAVHRIVLDPRTAKKACELENPKLTLGRPMRGAVRLSKATRTLGLAEGVETAMSAARRLGIPVWAVVGSERFPLVDIPFDVNRLVLLPDRGAAGDRAADLAEIAHGKPDRTIERLPPPGNFNDWNDADQAEQHLPSTAPIG
jgi:putative DNA primase/helicase